MASEDKLWDKNWSRNKSIEVFKTKESWEGSNIELYVDIKKHLELKEKWKKSMDNVDQAEIYKEWIHKGYITSELDQIDFR